MADAAAETGQSEAKVFISYSRKDMPFADRLDAALKARGFEPLSGFGELLRPRRDIVLDAGDLVARRGDALLGLPGLVLQLVLPPGLRLGLLPGPGEVLLLGLQLFPHVAELRLGLFLALGRLVQAALSRREPRLHVGKLPGGLPLAVQLAGQLLVRALQLLNLALRLLKLIAEPRLLRAGRNGQGDHHDPPDRREDREAERHGTPEFAPDVDVHDAP